MNVLLREAHDTREDTANLIDNFIPPVDNRLCGFISTSCDVV